MSVTIGKFIDETQRAGLAYRRLIDTSVGLTQGLRSSAKPAERRK